MSSRDGATGDGFRFRHQLQVRFRDCDPMRHANNAVYFTYLEQARFAYWREVVGSDDGEARSFILARAECDYRSPAMPGESLEIRIKASGVGRSSFRFDYQVVAAGDGREIARARTVQVMFDYDAQRPVPVPDDLVDLLEKFEGRALRETGRGSRS